MKDTDSMFDGFGKLLLSFVYALIGIVMVSFLIGFAAASISFFYSMILSMFVEMI